MAHRLTNMVQQLRGRLQTLQGSLTTTVQTLKKRSKTLVQTLKKKLEKKPKPPKKPKIPPFVTYIDATYAQIPTLDLEGRYYSAGTWVFLLRDGSESWYDECLLLNTKTRTLVWRMPINNPYIGGVSANGTTCLCDFSATMSARLYIFSAEGMILFEHLFSDVAICNCAISPSGTIVVCKTIDAKSRDANTFFVYESGIRWKLIGKHLQRLDEHFDYHFNDTFESFEIHTHSGRVISYNYRTGV